MRISARKLAAASLAAFTSGGASEALGGHASVVGWKRGTLWTAYSRCFNFTQLRFSPRGLHTAREAIADARSSAGEPGRCAKWYGNAHARRRLQFFCGAHDQRRGAALEGQLESAAVISRIIRERRANRAGHPHGVLLGWSSAACRAQYPFLCHGREVWSGRLLTGNSAAHKE